MNVIDFPKPVTRHQMRCGECSAGLWEWVVDEQMSTTLSCLVCGNEYPLPLITAELEE